MDRKDSWDSSDSDAWEETEAAGLVGRVPIELDEYEDDFRPAAAAGDGSGDPPLSPGGPRRRYERKRGPRRHRCDLCPYVTRLAGDMRVHRQRHKNPPARWHRCEICGISFYADWHLKDHKKTKHADIPSFICGQCDKGFRDVHQLMEHRRNSNTCRI